MKLLRLLWSVLREIGDENGYDRYLAARGVKPSRETWRLFSEEKMSAKYRKPKCC